MYDPKITFGEFIRQKRIEKSITLRKMADYMGYSPTYWSDIENGRRNPPGIEKLSLICQQLVLSSEEKDQLFDLAGDFVQVPPPDLNEYLQDPTVRRALRTAKKHHAASTDWEKFEQSILKKNYKDSSNSK